MAKTSETHRGSTFVEDLIGSHHHYTVIRDGDRKVCYHGDTPEESQSGASDMWDDRYGDDDDD